MKNYLLQTNNEVEKRHSTDEQLMLPFKLRMPDVKKEAIIGLHI